MRPYAPRNLYKGGSMKKNLKTAGSDLKDEFKKKSKTVLLVYLTLRILVVAALIRSIMLKNYENAFICVLVLFLFILPFLIERKMRIDLPDALEIIILLHIFAAEILGELQGYFIHYAHWDTILHTSWGFLCAALGFSLVDILNRNSRIKFNLSPAFVAVVAFCFSMTVGIFWEFFEFGVDVLLAKDMQKDTIVTSIYSTMLDPTKQNVPHPIAGITETIIKYGNGQQLSLNGYLDIGIYDTMEDLFVNFIGASVFSIIGFFYIKKRGDGKIARQFIPTLVDDTPSNSDESNAQRQDQRSLQSKMPQAASNKAQGVLCDRSLN